MPKSASPKRTRILTRFDDEDDDDDVDDGDDGDDDSDNRFRYQMLMDDGVDAHNDNGCDDNGIPIPTVLMQVFKSSYFVI